MPVPLRIPIRLRDLNKPRTEEQVNYVNIIPVLPAADNCLTVKASKELLHHQVNGHNSEACVLIKMSAILRDG
jgi:hypothetical protein